MPLCLQQNRSNHVSLTFLNSYNKLFRIDELDRIARQPHSVVISCELNMNMDFLIQRIWKYLALIRVYTKKPGNAPDLGKFNDNFILIYKF
jgi:ribosome-interacting GTPase 1